ncbi:unnamed protein product [Thelazia callipaeda]|uniref:MYND-type domain-containing protein n=1 Tax=Thelazia callipaeda TaxID=103827 RepID=A0A0N5CPG4_THECL|nr:unnamed protein product [Thelazia callipaeda]
MVEDADTCQDEQDSTQTASEYADKSSTVKQLPGYTVTPVPTNWNIPKDRHSRVVEVTDTFIDSKVNSSQNDNQRFDGRVTIEEVMDAIFQRTKPSKSSPFHDKNSTERDSLESEQVRKSGIYVRSSELMQQLMRDPSKAEVLLQNERLYIRCTNCCRAKELSEARIQYISCKHCYTYYCSRECREDDWSKHREICSFSRINTLCKEVIIKVRKDPEAQSCMSKIAREGYSTLGRGSVNLRIDSAQTAQCYVTEGWQTFANYELNKLLHYYTIAALIAEKKEPSLITLCRQYNPNEKFILSVSIIADIEQCPHTPPPEPVIIGHTQTVPLNHQRSIPSLPVPPLVPGEQSLISTDEFRSAVPTKV